MTDPTIDKAALEAARRGWNESNPEKTGDLDRSMQAAITAYLAALPSTTDAVGVTVRELEWAHITSDMLLAGSDILGGSTAIAKSAFGEYQVWGEGSWRTPEGKYTRPTQRETIETGIAAAQADYTARIMASLNIREVEPAYWHNGMGQVLTAAQKAAEREQVASRFDQPLYASPTTSPQAPEGVRDGWVLVPDDLLTHINDWRSACQIALHTAAPPTVDSDDKSYWRHQLSTLDRIEAALKGNRT